MAGVPHLQELHNKFSDKGFAIVAVSKEDAGTIESKLIKAKEVTYGVVKADIGSIYQTRGIPHCWVLDADGKCIFEGHPSSVTEQSVEEWTKDIAPTKVDRELAKDLKNGVKAFEAGELGKALAEAKEAQASEDELVKTDGAYLESLVKKHVDMYTGKMESAKKSGDLVKLGKTLEEASEKFKGSEQGDKWKDELKELEKSDAYKDTTKAADELEKIRDKLEDMRPSSARKKLEKIAEKYPDTPAGKEAAELAKRYNE
ncbi:MAG: hypothetical protein KDB68_09200 [Planctomycetes bacterium]|nr:hypothetical protein [Planctomycetota bacterium]MCA8936373.1 hypothetical protein [Planctomycetota bacterium]